MSLVDIGYGVSAELRTNPGEAVPEGVYYEHPCGADPKSPGFAPLKPHNPDGWDLVSVEPLTITPSLLCRACGHHGFVREGRWVPA